MTNCGQYVPSTFVKQMKTKERAIKVKLQCRGKEWDAVVSTYGTSSKINNGWSTFAWENSLRIGDACVVELINRKDALIRVTIFKCTNWDDLCYISLMCDSIFPSIEGGFVFKCLTNFNMYLIAYVGYFFFRCVFVCLSILQMSVLIL